MELSELDHPKIRPVVKQLSWHVGSTVVWAERWGESNRIFLLFENDNEHVLVFVRGKWKLGFRKNISAAELLEVLDLEREMR